MDRKTALNQLRQRPHVDVLIIGAGINGIGAFRDLALNGVNTLIVDRGDFCSGASAASSHMLHGGIRYLENGEFRLVKEALHERNLLLKNAPHYARPLPTTVPIFKWLSGLWNAPLKFLNLLNKPAERGAVVIKIGLMAYDAFVRGQSQMPPHRFLMRDESLREFPSMNPEIICAANYYDAALIAMERFCVELILDAEAEGDHARALNYVSVAGAQGGRVTLRDETTGKAFEVQPRVVINAAGPWVDFANRALGIDTKFIGGTKGSHLVLNHSELRQAIGDHEIFFENTDGRIVLINPFGDRVLVGTTDIHIDDPDQAVCDPAEETYILSLVKKVFPDIAIDPAQIVFRFSGVRPLPTADAKAAGQISRDHSIKVTEAGGQLTFPVLSLIGGKWTTYRAFAEQAADAALKRLGGLRQRDTKSLPVGGGRDYPASQAGRTQWIAAASQQTGLSVDRLAMLFQRYGTRARAIAERCAAGRGQDKVLKHHPAYSQREIAFLVENERVIHLDDLILRRSLLGIMGELALPLLKELAALAGAALGWSKTEVDGETRRVVAMLRDRHGVSL